MKQLLKIIVFHCSVISVLAPGLAFADTYEAGVMAIKRGHFETVMRAFMPLAEAGRAEAQNNVGHFYEQGLGVTQDYEQAISWYLKASEQGLAAAQHNAGMLYYNGTGVEQDYSQALFYLNKQLSRILLRLSICWVLCTTRAMNGMLITIRPASGF